PPQLGSGSPGRRRARRGGRLRGRGAGTEGVFGRLAGREKNEGLPLDAAILIRYGEIGLKGGYRPAFERQLAHNVDAALRGLGARRARRIYGRLLVDIGEDAVPDAIERLQRVFGIVGARRSD